MNSIRGKFSFIKYRNLVGGYPEFKDIRGAYDAGDLETAMLVVRDIVAEHAMALTFVAGDTNTKPKWLARKLSRLPSELQPFGKRILDWLLLGCSDHESKSDWILAGISIIDEIYGNIRSRLDLCEDFYTVSEAKMLTEEEYLNESFHDFQTMEEYNFRRRQFDSSACHILTYLSSTGRKSAI
jgi:hypothetical protein